MNFNKIFGDITLTIDKLQANLQGQAEQLHLLIKRVSDLEIDKELNASRIKAYELVRLTEWAKREQDVMVLLNLEKKTVPTPIYNDQIQNHRYVISLTQPIEQELKKIFNLNIKLLDLRKIASDRNIYAHQSVDTVDQQKDFLDECRNFELSAQYQYTDILEMLIGKLTERENAKPDTQLKTLKN
ncbi:unnamed protein product [Adineta steineri]|uniref:Uncharacterized protein n=1 Tax=Adineta steineri TaxID=433720 RepID=A0A819BKP1_9BILA|nr:unnamed protein product [Adineta steineri]CAF3798590.1 unnamed protein product [Adineta steineri]